MVWNVLNVNYIVSETIDNILLNDYSHGQMVNCHTGEKSIFWNPDKVSLYVKYTWWRDFTICLWTLRVLKGGRCQGFLMVTNWFADNIFKVHVAAYVKLLPPVGSKENYCRPRNFHYKLNFTGFVIKLSHKWK